MNDMMSSSVNNNDVNNAFSYLVGKSQLRKASLATKRVNLNFGGVNLASERNFCTLKGSIKNYHKPMLPRVTTPNEATPSKKLRDRRQISTND